MEIQAVQIADIQKAIERDTSDQCIHGGLYLRPLEGRSVIQDGSYFQFPIMRWSASNFRQLMPMVNVSRATPLTPVASNSANDPVTLPAFEALVQFWMRQRD